MASSNLFFGFLVATLLLSLVQCQGAEDLHNSENADDLETAEFFFWPKLFLAKAALGKSFAVSKTVHVDTTPVVYSYKPVTYTAYKWVPVPYQYTVQQPYIDSGASATTSVSTSSQQVVSQPAPAVASGSVAVRAPFVNVDVVKSAGTFSADTGSVGVRAPFVDVDVVKNGNSVSADTDVGAGAGSTADSSALPPVPAL